MTANFIMNGYLDGLESVRQKVDSVPYEKFPFCCSSDNTLKKEMDFARSKNLVPIQQPPPKQEVVEIVAIPQKPQIFWTVAVIEKYSNLKSAYSTTQQYNQFGQLVQGNQISQQDLRVKNRKIEQKYKDIREQIQQEANREYLNNKNERDPEFISYEQYKEMVQQINYDVAWQIFDEVNQQNEVEQIIDLNCLDVEDAYAIVKQKIFDLGKLVRDMHFQNQLPPENYDQVLCIVCAENHLIPLKNKMGQTPLTNAVLEMVRSELKMDHYYISPTRIILVRVNPETLDNPILKE